MDRQIGNSALDELHERRLAACLNMFHTELGIAAAMHYCAEHQLTPSAELVTGACELIFSLLRNDKTHRRGRAAGIVARYRQDMVDYTRWDVVCEVREKQKELPGTADELRQGNAPRDAIKETDRMRRWAGRDWLRAYECASMILQRTDAHAGPDAIKSSYLRVCKNSAGGKPRYRVLGRAIEKKLGIDCSFQRRVNKFVAYYNLTL